MSRLEKYGLMAGLVTPFDAAGRFDEKSFGLNVERCIEEGASTVYTTGGAAEFFSIELNDFKSLVKTYAKAAAGWDGNKQIGCHWINTQGVVERIKVSLDNEIETVQVTVPFWMPITLDEQVSFFAKLAEECPSAKLFHYNAAQSKNQLNGKGYARVAKEVPSLVGTKIATTSFMEWLEVVINAPMLDHCCCEPSTVPAAMTGAAGVASSWFLSNPVWFKGLYDDCVAGRWEEAMKKQVRMHEAYQKVIFHYDELHSLSDAAGDKALAIVGGFLSGGLTTRNPVKQMDEKVYEEYAALMRKVFPDLLYQSGPQGCDVAHGGKT